jgi:hypothetical protein
MSLLVERQVIRDREAGRISVFFDPNEAMGVEWPSANN